ncbi:hypothetical protein VP496E541_P0034 [Vibrio phage 496E54-1]|nr:hypothetical protein VP495E541_P0034 [Vibrio phage 495E54-1]CAH9012324.1 hypothetical protein VP496E541_P0034 [Vibrio phage 496E54-1]
MKTFEERLKLLQKELSSKTPEEVLAELQSYPKGSEVFFDDNDCRLCSTIYRCTETLPELLDCIQLDPEGVFQMHINYYLPSSDDFHRTSRSINYCPTCGNNLRESGFIILNESRAKKNTEQQKLPSIPTPPPLREILNGRPK